MLREEEGDHGGSKALKAAIQKKNSSSIGMIMMMVMLVNLMAFCRCCAVVILYH